jgi:hypothetical protein
MGGRKDNKQMKAHVLHTHCFVARYSICITQ